MTNLCASPTALGLGGDVSEELLGALGMSRGSWCISVGRKAGDIKGKVKGLMGYLSKVVTGLPTAAAREWSWCFSDVWGLSCLSCFMKNWLLFGST